jgi:hypothetical protein
MTVVIDPGAYREVHRMCQEAGDGGGRLEVLSFAATDGVDMHVQPQRPAAQPDRAGDAAAERWGHCSLHRKSYMSRGMQLSSRRIMT